MSSNHYIYGMYPVIEALKSGEEIDKVLIQNGLQGINFQKLRELLKEKQIPYQFVPVEKLNKIVHANHQGVIAFTASISYYSTIDILPVLFEEGKVPFLIMLDRITDVRNLGAIARTAECAGVHAIIIPSKGSAQINEDAIKTSAGALLNIPVCREENLKTIINFAKQSGLQVCAATERAQTFYTDVDFNLPTLLILGSEENGVSNEYLKLCDVKAKLPLLGKIESLNVSVAGGILMYEVIRQRKEII